MNHEVPQMLYRQFTQTNIKILVGLKTTNQAFFNLHLHYFYSQSQTPHTPPTHLKWVVPANIISLHPIFIEWIFAGLLCCFKLYPNFQKKFQHEACLCQLNQWLMNPGQNLFIKHPGFPFVLIHLHPRVYFNTGLFSSFSLFRIKKNERKPLLRFGYSPHAELSFLFKKEEDCICVHMFVSVCRGLFMGILAW